ncbi:hypothetical protein FRB97_009156 [Tulasnella sp. 331]|nr:hypothetical protein FRB97_009156 [Tulasnella sp. 331]
MASGLNIPAAIEIPGILEEIIALLPLSCMTSAALVCRHWSDVTLPEIWRDLPSLAYVLHLLTPLGGSDRNAQVDRYDLEDVDWERFNARTRLIRSLTWNDSDFALDNELFYRIFLYRSHTEPLFPKLIKVRWHASEKRTALQLLPIIPPCLKILRLSTHNHCDKSALNSLLKVLASRSTPLEEFHLDTYCQLADIVGPLTTLLRAQKGLKRVGLPHYYGHPDVVDALGALPSLEGVYTTNCLESGNWSNWIWGDGRFEKLRVFEWTDVSLGNATEVIKGPLSNQLISISLTSFLEPVIDSGINAFTATLARAIPLLECLTLNLFTSIDGGSKTFAAFEPLLGCRQLRTLEVYDKWPISLCEEDLRWMAEAWPLINILRITSDPTAPREIIQGAGASLTLLSAFAEFFGDRLEHLGFYLRLTEPDTLDACVNLAALSNLKTLSVGTSEVTESYKLDYAAFLAGICPPGVQILWGKSPLSIPHTFILRFPDGAIWGEIAKQTIALPPGGGRDREESIKGTTDEMTR